MKKILLLAVLFSSFAKAQTIIYGKQNFKDSLTFSKYKNNSALDSVLIVDTLGKLKQKKLAAASTPTLQQVTTAGNTSTNDIIVGNPSTTSTTIQGNQRSIHFLNPDPGNLMDVTLQAQTGNATYYLPQGNSSGLTIGIKVNGVAANSLGNFIVPTIDTQYLRRDINLKLNYTDTAAMLTAYRSAINLKVNISDTAAMLTAYRNAINTNYAQGVANATAIQQRFDSLRNNNGVLEGRKAGIFYPQFSLPVGWSLTGNTAIDTAANFLGTIDNKFLDFRTKNLSRLRIDTLGNVMIGGGANVGYRFQVNGGANITTDINVGGNGGFGGSLTANGSLVSAGNTSALSNLAVGFNAGIVPLLEASAIQEIRSTTRGFLPPRMTSTQRDAIASPATGLQIFNTTTGKPTYYSGTAWVEPSIGTTYTGTAPVVVIGSVISVDTTKAQGKLATYNDVLNSSKWTASGANIYNNNSGNVFVGATTSIGAEKLQVTGDAIIGGTKIKTISGVDGIWFNQASPNFTNYNFLYDNANQITLLNAPYRVDIRVANDYTNAAQFVGGGSLILKGGLSVAQQITSASLATGSAAPTTTGITKLAIVDASGMISNLSAMGTAPASSTATGTTGEVRFTSGYIYVCTATNTWVRSALTTF